MLTLLGSALGFLTSLSPGLLKLFRENQDRTHELAIIDRQSTLRWAVWWAVIGRSLYHADLVRKGQRRFWSLQLAWELMIAIGMGVVAGGAAEYLKLTGMAAAGFIAAVSYLGPRTIAAVQTWAERKAGINDPAD